jgi:DNA-binding LytR/AlgR family response regulator
MTWMTNIRYYYELNSRKMNNNLTRCLIIDDEPLGIKLIRTHLEKFESFEVAGECSSALKAFEYLKSEKIDLIFLDINMPEVTGIDFLRTLTDPPYVIITTAYREYAIEGYDLDIVDFLLKPISFERFLKAINRYCNRTRTSTSKDGNGSGKTDEKKHIYIQDGKNAFKLFHDDIIFFEGYGEYVKVITINKIYLVRDSLAEFEHKLSPDFFLRIHKSYLINIGKILGFTSSQIMIKNSKLPIGRVYREKVMMILRGDSKI